MIYPSINSLQKKIPNRFALVIVVSKRVRQISSVKQDLNVRVDPNKSITCAIKEVDDGKVRISSFNEPS